VHSCWLGLRTRCQGRSCAVHASICPPSLRIRSGVRCHLRPVLGAEWGCCCDPYWGRAILAARMCCTQLSVLRTVVRCYVSPGAICACRCMICQIMQNGLDCSPLIPYAVMAPQSAAGMLGAVSATCTGRGGRKSSSGCRVDTWHPGVAMVNH
jgi:hypothetical protein